MYDFKITYLYFRKAAVKPLIQAHLCPLPICHFCTFLSTHRPTPTEHQRGANEPQSYPSILLRRQIHSSNTLIYREENQAALKKMADESVNASGTKKKKKSIFKRIAKGMSIKKKKKHPDDASVMGVSVAENSVTGPPMSNGNKVAPLNNPPIQIILLLMDPNSRRFELLQLEFDSSKALVSDVLLQVNLSATETTLRDMVYGGVCDQTGMEMIASCKLSMFCNPAKNEIILAMPKGMSGSETAVLAKPILEDEKVVEMVSTYKSMIHEMCRF
jgi:hypothetical protein